MIWALIAAVMLCKGFDYAITLRRMRKYGWEAERNPITLWLCQKFGLQNGLIASTIVLPAIWSFIALQFNWPLAYALFAGATLHESYIRYLSLEYEKELDKIRAASKTAPPLG